MLIYEYSKMKPLRQRQYFIIGMTLAIQNAIISWCHSRYDFPTLFSLEKKCFQILKLKIS